MPGYRLASADTQRIDRMYFCCLCDLLLREAVQTDCGHMYCRSCLDIMHTDSYGVFQLTCIQDNTILCPNNQVFPDMFMRREVFALEVFCTFMEDGCEWKGEVKDLEAHTNNSCEFRKLSCVYRECGMLVKKSDLCQHLETECECGPKTCGFCKNQISLNKLKLHQERECPAYPVVCEKCNKDVLPRAKLLEHQDPVMGDCDAVQGPCPFAQIGCSSTQELNPRQTREHLHLHHGLTMGSEMGAPFTRVSRIMGSLHTVTNNDGIVAENENLREQLRHFSDRINSVERTVASGNFPAAACAHVPGDSGGSAPNNEITRRVNNLENRTADAEALSAEIERSVMETNRRMDFHEHELAAGSVAAMEANRAVNNLRSQFVDKTADHEVLLEESNRKIMEANRAVNNLKSQVEGMQENMERMERRVKSMEDALTLRNVQMADLEEYVRQQELSSYDGVLHWKITEFERRRNEAVSGQQVSFYSPCFSTSRYGYKMCARIYLNGDGMGLGTHISLFFVVMRGQYDAILRWPFRQKVTFMLLDQDNVEHVIDAFRPDPNSSSFQRPRRETNVASGCPMFCSLTELNNHAYVRDDAMVVKIIVDTTDL